MAPESHKTADGKIPTGVAGLDDVLGGGWPSPRMYLVSGAPGTGKTTMGLQFLTEGVARGERALYITLSETRAEIEQMARSHGWSLDGIELFELDAAEGLLGLDDEQTMFDPSDVEYRETSRAIEALVERVTPHRIVFDSLSELALLARDAMAFRRELLSLKQKFLERDICVLLLSDGTTPESDRQLYSLAHGVIQLEELSPEYGAERRRMRLTKVRGATYRGGYHDMRIETGGVEVFPRLVASEHGKPFSREPLASGVPELDRLLGGGLPRGASTLVIGPAGSGKSTVMMQFALASAVAGETASLFLFDEGTDAFLYRASNLGLDLEPHLESGRLQIVQIDPAELPPGQFVQAIRVAVEEHGARFVALDSLNGYMQSMPEERYLATHVHELLVYLNQLGVASLIVLAQAWTSRPTEESPNLTYVADAALLLRFFEAGGRVRRAMSVLKNRHAAHEDAIRECSIGPGGLVLGPPLTSFQGVLTGTPTYVGREDRLIDEQQSDPS